MKAAVATGTVSGAIGFGASAYLERLPRSALGAGALTLATGVVAGAAASAALHHDAEASPIGRVIRGGALGAVGGAALLAGIAGAVVPIVATVTRGAAMFEFGLYGAAVGLAAGSILGASA